MTTREDAHGSDYFTQVFLLPQLCNSTIEREGDDETFEVEFAEAGKTVTVSASESILKAAKREGMPVIFSCETGTCGTCETPVLSGTVDHRDSILTNDEQAANDTMMICVSRADKSCAKLVLSR